MDTLEFKKEISNTSFNGRVIWLKSKKDALAWKLPSNCCKSFALIRGGYVIALGKENIINYIKQA